MRGPGVWSGGVGYHRRARGWGGPSGSCPWCGRYSRPCLEIRVWMQGPERTRAPFLSRELSLALALSNSNSPSLSRYRSHTHTEELETALNTRPPGNRFPCSSSPTPLLLPPPPPPLALSLTVSLSHTELETAEHCPLAAFRGAAVRHAPDSGRIARCRGKYKRAD